MLNVSIGTLLPINALWIQLQDAIVKMRDSGFNNSL